MQESADGIRKINLLRLKLGQDLRVEREILSRSFDLWKTDLTEKERLDLIAVLGEILERGSRFSALEALDSLILLAKSYQQDSGFPDRSLRVFEGVLDQLIRVFPEKNSNPILVSQIGKKLVGLVQDLHDQDRLKSFYSKISLISVGSDPEQEKKELLGRIKREIRSNSRNYFLDQTLKKDT